LSTTAWIVAATLAAVLLVSLACWVLWRRVTAADRRLLKRISRLPLGGKLALAWRLYRDPRIPTGLRFLPPALVLYLAMPIDIVPDFLPVIGQLDDVLVIVAAVALLFRFVGREVLVEHIEGLELEALPAEREAIGTEGSPPA
jgi:uncharacterized membrane protein YkvA (DUF1232 family)